MVLALDIGNSNIVLGLHDGKSWTRTFRYETLDSQPELYYESALRSILLEWNIHPSSITVSILSSVVPDLNTPIKEAINNITGHQALLLNHEVFENLDIFVPHPYEIGADLVANAYGALKLYKDNCIIVDFGTALTFTIVSKDEGIKGVSFVPGIKTAIQSLSKHTAQLPLVPISIPTSAIGTDTVTAIQSGVMWGYVGLVKELIAKMKSELVEEYKVVATGGLSSILKPLETEFDYVNKQLTLEGIRLIHEFSKKNKCCPTMTF